MAKARSTVYDAATHGGLGNLIAQRDRHGRPYVRSRRTGRRRPSPRQAQIRNNWKLLQLRWQHVLTRTQRDGWDAYAHHPDVYDDETTGQLTYIRSNAIRLLARTDPDGYDLDPVIVDEHPHFPLRRTLDSAFILAYAGDPYAYLDWLVNNPLGGNATNAAILIFATPINWQGRVHIHADKAYPFPFNVNAYRYLDTLVSHPTPNLRSPPYAFRLQHTPAEGDLINLRAVFTDFQARTSPPLYLSARVQPAPE